MKYLIALLVFLLSVALGLGLACIIATASGYVWGNPGFGEQVERWLWCSAAVGAFLSFITIVENKE